MFNSGLSVFIIKELLLVLHHCSGPRVWNDLYRYLYWVGR